MSVRLRQADRMHTPSLVMRQIRRPNFRGHALTVVSLGTSRLFVSSLRRDTHVNKTEYLVRTAQ